MTEDKSIKEMLSFLLASDTYYQNIWLRSLKIKMDSLFLLSMKQLEIPHLNHIHYSFSKGEESRSVMDGKTAPAGEPFEYRSDLEAFAEKSELNPAPLLICML